MKTINSTITSAQSVKGGSLVRLQLADGNQAFINPSRLADMGYPMPQACVGQDISVDFFEVGEALLNGGTCEKEFSLSLGINISDNLGVLAEQNTQVAVQLRVEQLRDMGKARAQLALERIAKAKADAKAIAGTPAKDPLALDQPAGPGGKK
jgi:hypothetical protein